MRAEEIPAGEIPPIIRLILAYYSKQGKNKEHLGQTIDHLGWDEFRQQVIPEKFNN